MAEDRGVTSVRLYDDNIQFLRNQAAVLMLEEKLNKAPTTKEMIDRICKEWESSINSEKPLEELPQAEQ